MSRSIWKGPYCSIKDFKKTSKNLSSRNFTILPEFIDNSVTLTNGKDKLTLIIKKEMVGRKFGEFLKTRKWTNGSKN